MQVISCSTPRTCIVSSGSRPTGYNLDSLPTSYDKASMKRVEHRECGKWEGNINAKHFEAETETSKKREAQQFRASEKAALRSGLVTFAKESMAGPQWTIFATLC